MGFGLIAPAPEVGRQLMDVAGLAICVLAAVLALVGATAAFGRHPYLGAVVIVLALALAAGAFAVMGKSVVALVFGVLAVLVALYEAYRALPSVPPQ